MTETNHARLSDLIIGHPEVTSFSELEKLVAHAGESGIMHLEFDLKPDYKAKLFAGNAARLYDLPIPR